MAAISGIPAGIPLVFRDRSGGAESVAGADRVQPVTRAGAAEKAGAREGQAGFSELSERDAQLVEKLKARDREVRAHEAAHASAGGAHAGQPSYTYQSGPDGKRYAVGGEVPIDLAAVPDDPAATIEKMEQVKRAALAPAEPSSADRRIAAEADAKLRRALTDLADARTEGTAETGIDRRV